MKVLALATLAASASAFQAPTMTFAVGRKAAPAKKAAPKAKAAPQSTPVGTVPAGAIPGEVCPAILDGSMIGDAGFDPCFLSTKADSMAPYFNGIFGDRTNIDGIGWYREAELMHGRICQMAVLGFIAPGFGTISGNEWTGADAYSYTNPLEAWGSAPGAALFQIFAFMSMLEFRRINFILEGDYTPGDAQNWGQTGWNPFGLDYTPEEYANKQLQEIKHCRLAMIGFLGVLFQANNSGISVVDQLGAATTTPEYFAKAGYFFPEGI